MKKIGIIGLGYVGLPLAVEFAKQYPVVGFDINQKRIQELQANVDHTLELNAQQLQAVANQIQYSSNPQSLQDCQIFIITVPTPVDINNRPDLTPLKKASELVATVLKKGDIVIYESTVYPGVTEEYCVPILEKNSGLTFNQDFFAGYSPERINPGDKNHTVAKILKVTSGSTPEIAQEVNNLYGSIITAGTHLATSIKVAEAAKVIENAQRDINIAFVNELAKIFNLLQIDTREVLQAAATKWNFIPFQPGLVGGHCIGVDPYYLAQKAQEVGYHPEIILAGRRINDGMGDYVSQQIIKLMMQAGGVQKNDPVLLLGITFKENCPDMRNTKVTQIIDGLAGFGLDVTVYDPWVTDAIQTPNFQFTTTAPTGQFKAIVLCVAHNEFLTLDLNALKAAQAVVYDVKGILPQADARL